MITYSIATIIVLVLAIIISMFKVLREYERAVVFLLGRFYEVKGPGLIIIVPIIQQMVRVDLRTIVLDVPTQDLITRDNVSVRVNAVVYFRVLDPKMAINNVENYLEATSQLSQTTLRSVLGQHELDELLSAREELNRDLQSILDQHTDNWGIKVANVEIKHVDLDDSMVRALARQAEAERSRRAKVIHATGELEASAKLREAAQVLNQSPNAVQLRYMQTLTEIANDRTSTIVFPMPIDLVDKVAGMMSTQNASASPSASPSATSPSVSFADEKREAGKGKPESDQQN
ncbi:slipin family protein [Photobacterium aphoticum]|uniref:Putative stomatin/prohibitin-family membrane protease subunit aq_911 n=1 Tax=Photobacterium aphoticum TaxID=754436 RepID=A0A090R5X7_9GAMM|nr:slipin family protein [Photobacterium aphoticum]GAL03032.1 putative stomatin/prohibitin-family membrane protease subunit aq_911 [Photobacterium aphoticum]GHA34635.1 membrane protein [Photobacterium aphoticum]